MQRINLDNHSICKPSPEAIRKMQPFFSEMWGTPSVPHSMGLEVLPHMESSYKNIYNLLGATDHDVFVFTSSGAEAVNHVISSVYKDISTQSGKNHFITSNIDEAPAVMAISQLETLGCSGKMAEASDEGIVTADAIVDAITPRTVLVSLSWANGLTGTINPVSEIAEVCKQRGILFHVDVTNALGKLYIDLDDISADFITFNGNQIHGPHGTGGLLIREGKELSPFIGGGNEQCAMRGGSLNVPALIGLGQAALEASENLDLMCTEIARLRAKLENGILEKIPGAFICFPDSERLPNCSAITFPGVSNDALLFMLNRRGILASFGGNHFQKISLILNSSGYDNSDAENALSFSLSHYTTEEEVDEAIDSICDEALKLQTLSQQILN